MKVYIGPYRDWVGPYQIADLLQKVGVSEDRCHSIGEWLSNTKLYNLCEWVHSKKKRKIKVKIHEYDSWNVDDTLSHIIYPLLVQLKENTNSHMNVDDADVPEELGIRSTDAELDDEHTDSNLSKRSDWVFGEMIWAFQQLASDVDWMDQYTTGEIDIKFETGENGNAVMVSGKKHTHKMDWESIKKHQDRINRGTALFGKYFQALWD